VAPGDDLRRIDAGTGDPGLAPGATRHRRTGRLEAVADLIELTIPTWGRAVVVSDLHLTGTVTEASAGCTNEIITVLEAWSQPGVFVIAGDGFEQLHEPVHSLDDILDAHAEWTAAVHAFAQHPDRHVIVLSGNHDGNIAWDPSVVETLQRRLGADRIGIAADLELRSEAGSRRVHIVHGNQDDEYNAFEDPRSPLDTPTGHHVVRQVLPQLDRAVRPGGLLDGLFWLSEPMLAGEMVGSRLLYRGIGTRAWFFAIPFMAALVLRVLAFVPGVEDLLRTDVESWLIGLGVAVLIAIVLATVVTVLTLLGVHRSLAHTEIGERGGVGSHNANAREHAARIIELGYAGMITGHTHAPELSVVGDGFYANSGCGVEVLGPRRARLGLPRPFTSVRRITRVELWPEDELVVHLVVADVPIPIKGSIEKLVMRTDRDTPTAPRIVATLPSGGTWPVDPSSFGAYARTRRARRRAAGLLIAVAVVNITATIVGPELRRFTIVETLLPDKFPREAGVVVVLIAVAFIGLSRGVRRGYRQAWIAALALLGASAIVLLSRGVNFEQGIVNLALLTWLLIDRKYFRVLVTGRHRWGAWAVALVVASVGLAITLGIVFTSGERVSRIAVALAAGFVVMLALVVRRPSDTRMRTGEARLEDQAEARDLIDRLGGDTFDASALRDDKTLLFAGGGVVAYTVIDGLMVVSPDPICASDDRSEVWASAMDYADTHGWRVCVLAANASWIPIYHACGLHDVYIGDEAIVDTEQYLQSLPSTSFGADRDELTALGFAFEVVAAGSLTPERRATIELLASEAELGAPGHGFMTSIGRVASAGDAGAVLALCFSADGRVVAFNQFVPARNISGFTLDMSCTGTAGEHAEAVGHVLLSDAIRWMEAHDLYALSLGLAASGGRAYGEPRASRLPVEKRVLAHFADTNELDQRRRVDSEYGPIWRPRYLVTDAMRGAWTPRTVQPGAAPDSPAPA